MLRLTDLHRWAEYCGRSASRALLRGASTSQPASQVVILWVGWSDGGSLSHPSLVFTPSLFASVFFSFFLVWCEGRGRPPDFHCCFLLPRLLRRRMIVSFKELLPAFQRSQENTKEHRSGKQRSSQCEGEECSQKRGSLIISGLLDRETKNNQIGSCFREVGAAFVLGR